MFDAPLGRHHVPRLAWDGRHYRLVTYGGAPWQLAYARLDLTQAGTTPSLTVALGPGVQPQVALSIGQGNDRLGAIFIDFDAETTRVNIPRPEAPPPGTPLPDPMPPPPPDHIDVHQPQTYFAIIDAEGHASPRVALGSTNAQHAAPGASVAWHARSQSWGAVWIEDGHVMFGTIDTDGRPGAAVDLSPQARATHDDAAIISTASGFAVPISIGGDLVLVETAARGGAIERRTTIATNVLEPEVAFDGRRFGVVMRTATELRLSFVEDGRATPPVTIVRAETGRTIGAPTITHDPEHEQFVVAWPSAGSGHDDRLCYARLGPAGTPTEGFPMRIDDQEIHQGHPSFAGMGPDLAVSYILGDPNETARIGFVRGL